MAGTRRPTLNTSKDKRDLSGLMLGLNPDSCKKD